MAGTAVLFTGQGAQSVGMGRDIVDSSVEAAALFERANAVVGYDLRRICFEGPADRLEQTDIQQPAIFATSTAIWRALHDGADLNVPIAAMAGLSLGEYTALYAAGSVGFEEALRLVQRRGELMQAAARSVPGGMVTALGLSAEQAEAVCREAAAAGRLAPANFNCPGQIVLSGERAACEAAVGLIEQAGGRAIPLKVAGAFHSEAMRSAAEGLAEVLAATPFKTPSIPVVANINCRYHGEVDTIRAWLTDQLTNPVRWQQSIEALLAAGIDRFIEIGPGRILSGMVKKISRATPVVNISTAADIARVRAEAA